MKLLQQKRHWNRSNGGAVCTSKMSLTLIDTCLTINWSVTHQRHQATIMDSNDIHWIVNILQNNDIMCWREPLHYELGCQIEHRRKWRKFSLMVSNQTTAIQLFFSSPVSMLIKSKPKRKHQKWFLVWFLFRKQCALPGNIDCAVHVHLSHLLPPFFLLNPEYRCGWLSLRSLWPWEILSISFPLTPSSPASFAVIRQNSAYNGNHSDSSSQTKQRQRSCLLWS